MRMMSCDDSLNEDEKLCVPRLPGGPAGSNCWWGRNSGTDTSRDGDDDISHNDDDDDEEDGSNLV